MSTIPLVALRTEPPPSPIEQYGKVMQLKSLMQGQQLQQSQLAGEQQQQQQHAQLFPGQLQEQQQATQASGIDLQLKQLELQNRQIGQNAFSSPDLDKDFQSWQSSKSGGSTGAAAPPSGAAGTTAGGTVALHPFAQFLAEKKGLPLFGPGGAIDISNQLNGAAQKAAELLKTQGEAGEAALNNHEKQIGNFNDLAEPVLAEKDPGKQSQALANLQDEIKQHPDLYPQDASQHLDALSTPQGVASYANSAKLRQMVIDDAKNQAGLKEAQQKADIVQQLGTPQALADPGAQQAIIAKIQDPTTQKTDIPRLQALLARADAAQQHAQDIKAREERTQQAISQGDPDAAGQLLANRSLTLQELKTRGATPQFIANATKSAQKYDPNFKAAESEAQSKIAASPANQQFFGNTDSLLVKGGTLDQLEARGQALGNSKIPAYNSLANWTKAALGSGPQAAYAASVLGVADDYSKVMTGGQGSDTSRQQALDIISKNLSPEGRAAAVEQIREQVNSQREGRIGKNQYMRDMYPHPNPGGAGTEQPSGNLPSGAGKVIDKQTARQFYQAAGGDPNKARQLATQNGWKLQ